MPTYGRVGENSLEIFLNYQYWKITLASPISLRNFFAPHPYNLNSPHHWQTCSHILLCGDTSAYTRANPAISHPAPQTWSPEPTGEGTSADDEGRVDRAGHGKRAWAKDFANEEVQGVNLVVRVLDVRNAKGKNGEKARTGVRRVLVEAD